MKTERKIEVGVKIDSDGETKISTTVSETKKERPWLSPKDLERNRDNRMVIGLGKSGLDLGVVLAANIWAFEQITEGFHQENPAKIATAAVVYVAAARFGFPALRQHIREASVAKAEIRAVKNQMKGTGKK